MGTSNFPRTAVPVWPRGSTAMSAVAVSVVEVTSSTVTWPPLLM